MSNRPFPSRALQMRHGLGMTGLLVLLLGAATPASAGIIADDGYGEVVPTVEDVSATGDADAGTVLGGQPITAEAPVSGAPEAIATGIAPARSQA